MHTERDGEQQRPSILWPRLYTPTLTMHVTYGNSIYTTSSAWSIFFAHLTLTRLYHLNENLPRFQFRSPWLCNWVLLVCVFECLR